MLRTPTLIACLAALAFASAQAGASDAIPVAQVQITGVVSDTVGIAVDEHGAFLNATGRSTVVRERRDHTVVITVVPQ